MSKQIDEQVVSMQFDNRHFEKNVQTTLGSLEKLKQSLNLKGATKGLENVDAAAKKVDMSTLSNSVEKVGIQFNGLYTIADQALRNITNSAMACGKKIISAFAIDPIKTGFQEYETQINSVQTILANTESKGSTLQDVNNALAELNTYADKTIYNFTEMTRNIGTFTAAGVDLKTSVSAIKGIANLAAVSGSNSQQASTAMYQLSQALSSGTVKLMDWNSVVNAGMGGQVFQDALKETARVHGIAIDSMIESQGSFRETLQEGWLTSEILTETLSKFTGDLNEEQLKTMGYTDEQIAGIIKMGKTANDAATKVKTFTQLFDTLKEAAQSGWTKTWEIIVGDFGEAKDLLTEISDTFGAIIGESGDARNELLSGALSTGWKQLLNQGLTDAAGFEEIVSNVAKEHGVKLDEMIDDEHTFQDTLKDGWLNADILSKSIDKYGEKLLNMSEKELEAAGYTMKDVEAFKKLKAGIDEGKISIEEFTKLIGRKSGRELLIESLRNALNGVVEVLKPVKEAFSEIFPATTADQLYAIIEGIKAFTEKLTLSETQSENLKRTFKGLFAILDLGVQIIKAITGGVMDLLGSVLPAGNGILSLTAIIGDFFVKINEAAKSSGVFKAVIGGITGLIKPLIEGVLSFGKAISEAFGAIGDKAMPRMKSLEFIGNGVKALFSGLTDVINKLIPGFATLATGVGKAVSVVLEKITNAIQNADYSSVFDFINGGLFAGILLGIRKFLKTADDLLGDLNPGAFLESLKGILDGAGDALNAFTQSIKAKTLKTIASAIAILAASLFVISLIDSDKLTVSLTAVTTLFAELFASMSAFGKITGGKGFKSIGKVTGAMTSLSTSLLILSVALKIMSTMTWSEMAVGLTSLTVGLGVLIAAVKLLPEKGVKKAAKSISTLSKSLVVFAIAMQIMGSLSWKEMGVGLISAAVGMGILVAAVNLLPKETAGKAAKAISKLSSSLLVLSVAIKIMGSMSWKEMGVGLITMAVGLGLLVGATHLLPKDLGGKAVGMIVMATAMTIMAGALKVMGSMSWQETAIGLTVLAGSLIIIAGAMHFMKNALPGAAALLVVAASLAVIGPILKLLGSMDLASIGKALLALAGVFVVIGVAALVLQPLVPVIAALAGSITLFGVGILAAGAGVALFAAGLTALAAALTASGGAIVIFISGLVGLIPYIIEQIGVGIIKLCEVIAGSGDAICAAFSTLIVALVDALVISVPAIVDGVFVLIDSLIQSLIEYTPNIVIGLFDFIIAIMNALAQKLPDLIQAGVDLLMAFFVGVIDALKSVDPEILVKGILAVGMISALMIALAAMAALTPFAMIGVLGVGAVVAELAIVLAAIGALAQIPGLSWLVSEGGNFLQTVGTAIGQFLGGIVGGFAQGMSSALPQIGSDLSAFMTNATPFIEGARLIDSQTLDGVKSLVGIILALTGANIIESLTSWLTGGTSLAKYGEEIAAFAPYIKTYADTVKGIDGAAVEASANAAKALGEMAANLPNSGGVAGWFAGENDMSTFGEQLVEFGNGIKDFSEVAAGIQVSALDSAIASVNKVIELLNNVSNIDSEVTTNFSSSLTSLANTGIDGFTSAFDGSHEKIATGITGMLTKASDSVTEGKESVYSNFFTVGSSAVDGFVAGISENTFKAEAQAKAMAKAAEEAAKAELAVNSPSKKFMSIGGSVVEGFGKGITKNLGDVDKSATIMADTIVNATRSELKINSPSLVMNEQGHYVVQGIAEGIKSDMSAEEAAEQKAQNIVNAFQKVFDDYARDSEGKLLDLDYWKLTAGQKASKGELKAKELTYYKDKLTDDLKNQTLAWDEYLFTKDTFGENSKESKDALNKWKQRRQTAEETIDIIDGLSTDYALVDDRIQRLVANRNSDVEYWDMTTGLTATEAQKNARHRFAAEDNISDLNVGLKNALDEYYYNVEHYAPDSDEVRNAWDKVKQYREAIANEQKTLIDLEQDEFDRLINTYDENMSEREKRYKLWESQNKDTTTAAEKDAKYQLVLQGNLNDITSKINAKKERYNKLLAENKGETEEAKRLEEEILDLEIDRQDTVNQITDVRENAVERQKNILNQTADNADLEYQVWESTTGRNLTSWEKYPVKLASLNKQIASQATVMQMAKQEWNDAVTEHGENSEEAAAAYNAYLNEWLKLSNLQNEITDLNKKNADKQKLARSEYDDYIEKYKKFYLANGMTLADLERDAKLVSGYDPTKPVTNMVDNMTNGATTAFGDMGTTFANAVADGIKGTTDTIQMTTSTVVTDCADIIKQQKKSWVKAGGSLADGLAEGIRKGSDNAIMAAIDMATAALIAAKDVLDINSPSKAFASVGMFTAQGFAEGIYNGTNLADAAATNMGNRAINNLRNAIAKISEAVESDVDTQPTIRPVLDLTNVKAGATKLNAMVSQAQAAHISASMSPAYAGEIQNGTNITPAGTTFQFTQNNYSPKALSSLDIYRQTKNQFAVMKKEVLNKR